LKQSTQINALVGDSIDAMREEFEQYRIRAISAVVLKPIAFLTDVIRWIG